MANPDALTTAETNTVAANTQFALDLYVRLRAGAESLFFSPFSLSTALAMTASGARGETARELSTALHLPEDRDKTGAGFAALTARFQSEASPAETLTTANALWLGPGVKALPDYLEIVRQSYGAGLFEVDFQQPETARTTINAWVEAQTHQKICNLIASGVLNKETSTVLVNAIYFKGAWQSPFRTAATRDAAVFHAKGGHDVKVAMMAQVGSFPYLEGDRFQAVEMFYLGSGRSMVILLPNRESGLEALEADLKAENLAQWLKGLAARQVDLQIPKFTLTAMLDLNDPLQSLGIVDAFNPRKADFSGITGQRGPSISAVIHKAFVNVNESGTEAAAASAVAMKRLSVIGGPPPVAFHADRPFVVLIRDRETGSILFLGRLVNPAPVG